MKTIKLTMAQALMKFLDQQYISLDGQEHKFVQGIMGIFGHGNVTGIGQAIDENVAEIPYIRIQNEQGMVHTAIAYAKQKNRLGIYACTSSIGPGATNMLTGAATASINRIPVLLLPGDIFACRQPDPVLQQLEDFNNYETTVNDCFKPVSRYWDRVNRPEQLMTAMLHAMRVLTDPVETGAVTICLPQDVQDEAYDYPEEFFKKRVHHIDRRPISAASLDRVVDLIKMKKKPFIIAGGGVHYSQATEELQAFAETFGIPISETEAGKSAIPWTHPLSVGGGGVMGTKAANILAKDADLVLGIGTRLMDFTTISKAAFQNPVVDIVQINVNAFDTIKMDAFQVLADAKEALTALRNRLKEENYGTSEEYQKRIQELRDDWNSEVDRLYAIEPKENQPLPQTAVLGTVNEFVDENDIVVCAAGSLPGDLQRLWRCTKPKTFHLEYGYSCMGYEIAGGLGVKFAEPDAEVYIVVGDGSYLMLHTELLTSLIEHTKINIVLFDSKGFNCIEGLAKSTGGTGYGNQLRVRDQATGKLSGPPTQVDFVMNAKSYGAAAFKAETLEELKECLEKAKKETRSTLIYTHVGLGTMSPGYESWWRVGVAEVSSNPEVQKAHQEMEEKILTARKY